MQEEDEQQRSSSTASSIFGQAEVSDDASTSSELGRNHISSDRELDKVKSADFRRASASEATSPRRASQPRKPSPLSRGESAGPHSKNLHSPLASSAGGIISSRGTETEEDGEMIPWSRVSSTRGSSPLNESSQSSVGNIEPRDGSSGILRRMSNGSGSQSGTQSPSVDHSGDFLASDSTRSLGSAISTHSNELAAPGDNGRRRSSGASRNHSLIGSNEDSSLSIGRRRSSLQISGGNLPGTSGSQAGSIESANGEIISPYQTTNSNSPFEALGAALESISSISAIPEGESRENLSLSAGGFGDAGRDAFRPSNTRRSRKSSSVKPASPLLGDKPKLNIGKDELKVKPITTRKLSRGNSPSSHDTPPSAGGRAGRSNSLSAADAPVVTTPTGSASSSSRSGRGTTFSGGAAPTLFSAGVANLVVTTTASKSRKSTSSKKEVASVRVSESIPRDSIPQEIYEPEKIVEDEIVIEDPVNVVEPDQPDSFVETLKQDSTPTPKKEYKPYKFKRPPSSSKDPPPSDVLKYYDDSIIDIMNPGMPEPAIKIHKGDTRTKVNVPIVIPTNDTSFAAAKAVALAISGTRDANIQSTSNVDAVFLSDGFSRMILMG
jgi:hypothetical protein